MECWIDKCHRILQVYSDVKDASQHLSSSRVQLLKTSTVKCTKLRETEIKISLQNIYEMFLLCNQKCVLVCVHITTLLAD
jgi:hypothetical protein